MKKIIDRMTELIFPSGIYCIACDNLTDKTRTYSLCDRCITEIKWNVGRTCIKCGKSIAENFDGELCYDCRNANHIFDRGYSCVTYEGWAKRIIQNMKYKDRSYISEKIAQIMTDRDIDLSDKILVPVPMSPVKKTKRGYNQAELIAAALSKMTGSDYQENVIKRYRESPAMSSLSREQRKLNSRNEFFVHEDGKKIVEGKSILLIDDVFTTGSTADACAEALRNAGASKIDVFVFASGDNIRLDV